MNLETALTLYRKYADDLRRVREEQRALYRQAGYLPKRDSGVILKAGATARRIAWVLRRGAILKPQLDDIEAELTYLRIRESRPRVVAEISPCGGWSSTWILRALRDNGLGELHSFDMVPLARRNVPEELARGRWHFHLGDARENVRQLPSKVDYLFVDSDHSAAFARWYLGELFPKLASGTPISVHDVFHTGDAGGFDTEGPVVISWLDRNRATFFTASEAKNPAEHRVISDLRKQLGFSAPIHSSHANSMIFFSAPQEIIGS